MKKKYKHKITSGLTGVVLSFILLAAFSGLAYWFHITQNGAIIIGRILVIFAALAFILALYRAIFFKFLIEKTGFFYQTAPGNGRYFNYFEIRKIWVSSGRETNSNQTTYCNFETNNGKILRFSFTGADVDAVNYLIKRFDATADLNNKQLQDDNREHTISGKVQGLQRIAIVLFLFVIVFILTISLVKEGLPPLTVILPMLLATVSIIWVVMDYMFYKLKIQKDGFYCRTNPFNGRYFAYKDIINCKLVEKRKKFGSVYHKGTRETHYFYFLIFTDINNKKHRILYNKALFEREMQILVSRIENNKGDNNEAK